MRGHLHRRAQFARLLPLPKRDLGDCSTGDAILACSGFVYTARTGRACENDTAQTLRRGISGSPPTSANFAPDGMLPSSAQDTRAPAELITAA
jgi:hypothetical protein